MTEKNGESPPFGRKKSCLIKTPYSDYPNESFTPKILKISPEQ